MTKRKRTHPGIESDVLENSGRRCCVCYALHRDFKEKRGQVAHLDHNPANSRFDNLCFLCRDHHEDYDTLGRQSKRLTLNEVKRYRSDLYETIAEWKESTKAVNNLPIGSQIPLLNFFEETSSVVKTTTQGLQIVQQQAISEAPIQIQARFSDKVVEGLANHLDAIGLSKPFRD